MGLDEREISMRQLRERSRKHRERSNFDSLALTLPCSKPSVHIRLLQKYQ